MAASLTSLVNQRMACARMLLADVADARSPVHSKALLDACVFHLCCGYRFYIKELSSYYGVKYVDHLQDEEAAAKALSQIDKHPAEVQELCHLAEQADSWLSQLRALFEETWQVPQAETTPAVNTIALTNLDKTVIPELDADLIAAFIAKFQEVVDRQRETTVEC
ncbi:hypothetical protein QWI17_11145 [Gilvimarinus sp. SDUM040013]|uniref:DUF6586 family protein n=1 Tax=Gilvimarinus gilvus TaxID=3058038 RepID=A0ABU4RXN6_9GAMM|nr:DUF6586 family protein [Gilvimarinus sp. SDUM040013]MDO3386394.1 hypothetical protein [Gilvimarinus sp. SDUM040013]MDX6849660.1 DUF6586 family protein [Gilvimarinus sp. SDUM040013]